MMKGQKNHVLVHSTPQVLSWGQVIEWLPRQVTRWYQLYHQRQELAALSDAMLKDIGLSRADILRESTLPFWDDPLKR